MGQRKNYQNSLTAPVIPKLRGRGPEKELLERRRQVPREIGIRGRMQ